MGVLTLLGAGVIAVSSGGGGGTTTTWDPSTKGSGITLSGGNLLATDNSGTQARVRTVNGVVSGGKYYFELSWGRLTGGHVMLGIAPSTYSLTGTPGVDATGSNGVVTDGTSVYVNNAYAGDVTNATPATNDIFGFAVDMTAKKIYVRRITGGSAPRGFNNLGGDPVAGTGGYDFTSSFTATMYPVAQSDLTNQTSTFNGGGSAYALAAPSGYGNL